MMGAEYFLSGDIGGTKTRLQINRGSDVHLPVLRKSYASTVHTGLAEILAKFLAEAGIQKISAACFALAGPVNGTVVKLTNLPWVVDADALARQFSLQRVALINDFEAIGYGVCALTDTDLLTLQTGVKTTGATRLIVGAGTGLGVAWLSWQEGKYKIFPSEAGHMDFAAGDEMQSLLLRYFQKRYGHVSYERIVSGPGIQAIYEFLQEDGFAMPSDELKQEIAKGDAAAALTKFAIEGKENIALMTVDLFLSVYGAFTGNLALATLPRGGVYIAGGIAAKISGMLQGKVFMQACLNKGRYQELLSTLPVNIVLNRNVGLIGANLYAQQLVMK